MANGSTWSEQEFRQLDLGDAPEPASEDIDGNDGGDTDGERAEGV